MLSSDVLYAAQMSMDVYHISSFSKISRTYLNQQVGLRRKLSMAFFSELFMNMAPVSGEPMGAQLTSTTSNGPKNQVRKSYLQLNVPQ